jgi:hypothetical protein
MFEPSKIIAALLAIVGTTGIFLLWDRVCHALRVACAAGIVLLAGLFYGSGLAISGGALGIVLGSLTALVRTGLLRQRTPSGVRHETGN